MAAILLLETHLTLLRCLLSRRGSCSPISRLHTPHSGRDMAKIQAPGFGLGICLLKDCKTTLDPVELACAQGKVPGPAPSDPQLQ